MPVVYSTSVIDTPAIYVGSGAAAASNVTETLIISDTLNDNALEDEEVKSFSFLPFSSILMASVTFGCLYKHRQLTAIHTLRPITPCSMGSPCCSVIYVCYMYVSLSP